MIRKLYLSLLFVSLIFLSSCEKLFTLEGTIYLKDGERIARLSGTQIFFLDNKIEKIIKTNLDEYNIQSTEAVKKYQMKLVQEELKKNEKIIKDTISQIENNILSLEESKKLSAENIEKLTSKEKSTIETELKNKKETLKSKIEIMNSKKELKVIYDLLEIKKRKLSSVLMERKNELNRLNTKKRKKLARSQSSFKKNSKLFKRRIKKIRNEVTSIKYGYKKQYKDLALKYSKNYVQNKILIVNKLRKKCRGCTPELTFFIENKGNKAIRAINFDLHYKNTSLRSQGFKLSQFGAYGLDGTWYPSKRNKYRETVYGIAPKQRMHRSKSFYLRGRRSLQGDTLRFFEKIGGYDLTKFKVAIKSVYLSDPSTYHSYNPFSGTYRRGQVKRWKYKKQKLVDVFKIEILSSGLLKKTSAKIKNVITRQKQLTKEMIQRRRSFGVEKKKISALYNSFIRKKRKEISKAEKDVLTFKLTEKQKEKIRNSRKNISKLLLAVNSSSFKLKQMKANVKGLQKKKLLFKSLKEVSRKRLDTSLLKKKEVELEIKNLKDKKGSTFAEIQKFALTNTPLLEIQSLWINKFIEDIKIAKIHSGNSDVDGKFKFNKLTKLTSHIFAVANHETKRFMWFVELDLPSKSQQDLSDINNTVVNVKKLNTLFEYFNKAISVKPGDIPNLRGIVPMKN